MSLHLRPAAADEAPLLSALALRSKAHWGYPPEFMEACRAELTYTADDVRDGCFVVAEVDGRILGFYALERLSPDEVELEALFVDPRVIGHGHGGALLADAKTKAAALGARRMVIQGDPHAEPFYCAAGAQRTGERESASIPGRSLPLFVIHLLQTDRS